MLRNCRKPNIMQLARWPVQILITNNTLDSLAGSELYVYDLALELQRNGHNVTCFTLKPGLVAEHLREHGVQVTSDLASVADEVDVIHAHHNLEMRLAAARFPLTPLVYVSHGVTHPLEFPGKSQSCATRYVAVSEDVREQLIKRDGVPTSLVDVIPNFVDAYRFVASRPIAERPQRVLVVSHHFGSGVTRQTIEGACKLAGDLELRVIGATTESVWNVEDFIDWADVVITLGRGALQAMAMGRAVVVYDYRGGDGLVTPENFDSLAATNFAGRTYAHRYTSEQLASEILRYDRSVAEQTMRLTRERHALVNICRRLLTLYARAIEDFNRMWPPQRRELKLRATLWELAEHTISFKDAHTWRAEIEWTSSLLATRENELRQLHEAFDVLAAKNRELEAGIRRSESRNQELDTEIGRQRAQSEALRAVIGRQNEELSDSQRLLQRVAAGRVMRVMNGINSLFHSYRRDRRSRQ